MTGATVPGPLVVDLGGPGWTLRRVGPAPDGGPPGPVQVPAVVPGSVHTDLVRAGVIADPLTGPGETAAQWVGLADWEYATRFELPDAGPGDGPARVDLVCDGLQTVATVRVNGTVVAETRNMHRRYRLDVTGALRPGENELAVRFASSARAMLDAAGDDPLPYDWAYPYNELRTMACEVGWDWGPTLVTAGIWRPIRLELWAGARADVAVTTTLAPDLGSGSILVTTDLDVADPARGPFAVEIAARRSGGEGPPETRGTGGPTDRPAGDDAWSVLGGGPLDAAGPQRVAVDVAAPAVWWPRGYGDPALHDVAVRLLDAAGTVLQETRHRVGFRHVVLDTTPDGHGRACTVRINGRPVFCKGANWIPVDLFVSRITSARYAERVDQACAAHMTMLRVWGGGIYEDESFYAACDERGVLVWQDFAFACAAYPETGDLPAEVAAEADDVVRRLAAHPSVVLWNGGNECDLGWQDWGWPERVGRRDWGEGYSRELLPAAVARHAPGAAYVPNSPFSSEPGVHPQVPGDGTVHLWDPWNLQDYAHYTDEIPRFAAEFGFQSPAAWATLAEAVGGMPGRPDDPRLLAHQKQPGGAGHLVARLAGRFPDPGRIAADTDAWHLATQLNQAHALRTAAEHFRSWWPRTAGSLLWQFGDVWPALSWSIVDHAGRLKPAWYAVRRAYADRLVTIQPREAGLSVLLVNDTDEPWSGPLVLQRVHVTDGVQARRSLDVTVPPREVLAVPVGPAITQARRRREELVVADLADPGPTAVSPHLTGATRAVHVLVRDDGVRWPVPEPDCVVTRSPGRVEVSVRAVAALADLWLQADRVHPGAVVDSALVTLLPGEEHTLAVTVPADPGAADTLDGAALLAALRTRNELFHD